MTNSKKNISEYLRHCRWFDRTKKILQKENDIIKEYEMDYLLEQIKQNYKDQKKAGLSEMWAVINKEILQLPESQEKSKMMSTMLNVAKMYLQDDKEGE